MLGRVAGDATSAASGSPRIHYKYAELVDIRVGSPGAVAGDVPHVMLFKSLDSNCVTCAEGSGSHRHRKRVGEL